MNNRTHIKIELQSIAPELIDIPVAMPYTLPPAYFSGLASEILVAITNENELPESLANSSRVMPYTIPSGYFEQLPDLFLQHIRTVSLTEQEPTIFSQIPRIAPYAVPDGYFQDLPKFILQRIKEEEQQQTIPTGYFENLPETLLAKVRKLESAKELEEVAPLLNNISRQPVQHVPVDYFENLEPIISQEEQSAPVISIRKQGNWLKYAVAASILLLLSFGAYFLFSNNNTPVPSIANQPTVTVINQELANLDAATIENYLKTNNAIVQSAFPASDLDELSNGDLDDLLHGFTDQQLKEHIDETPDLPTLSRPKNHI